MDYNHIEGKEAKVQLKRLRKLDKKALNKKQNMIAGFYFHKPYEYIAFDNRTGNLWIGEWQHEGDCLNWLYKNPG